MKKLLLVTYHFPPDAAVGAVRPAEFAKYLPENGWEPTVLSVKEKYYENIDTERYKGLGISVTRTTKAGSINEIYMGLKRLGNRNSSSERTAPKGKEWFTSNNPHSEGERTKARLTRYYNSLLIYLPDNQHGWFFFALSRGLKLIRQNRIDAIYTTSPPHSVQLIGLGLKMISGKPWIADFRDPWEVDLKPKRSRSILSEMIERRMEKAVVAYSDRVVSVTGAMTERLKKIYPDFSNKFITLPNGYDSGTLSEYMETEKHKTFTITYVGSLYFGRNPLTFLTAISELIGAGEIRSGNIRVRLIGDCRISDGKSVEEMVKKLKLDGVVEFVDQVPHGEALREIARSQVLLLMAPCQPLQIPGKVYEYIGLRTPILSVCEEGATRDLMQAYPLARNVLPQDLNGMKESIMHFYQERDQGINNLQSDQFRYERYERRTISKELSSLFEEIVN